MSLRTRFLERWEVRVVYTLDGEPQGVSETVRPRTITRRGAENEARFLQRAALTASLDLLAEGRGLVEAECTIARVRR